MHAMNLRDDLTPAQAAALLPNTSVDSVRRWIRSGALPARTLPNGRYLVKRSDVEGLLKPVSAVNNEGVGGDRPLPGQDFLAWPTSGGEGERR